MFTLYFDAGRQPASNDLCLVFNEKNEVLLTSAGELTSMTDCGRDDFPQQVLTNYSSRLGVSDGPVFVGRLDERGVWLSGMPLGQSDGEFIGARYIWTPLRSFVAGRDDAVQELCFRALHLRSWLSRYRFCPSCGTGLELAEREMALACPSCRHVCYPNISPAVIVAITRHDGREILLAQGKHRLHNWYSLIAGYCEAGEAVERTVEREVLEEVGLNVRNLRYVGSQNWAFSQSMMLGFTAEYDSGELRPDPEELESAEWFSLDDLPFIPPPPSIANRLILGVQEEHRKRSRVRGGTPEKG